MSSEISELDIDLERDGFLRKLLRHLSGALQDIVGVEEASGLISVVGQRVGDELCAAYRRALGVEQLSREQVTAVLIDLERRIRGDFRLISADEHKLVLANRACPFGDEVCGRASLCLMTSNVFGVIAAENLGYAKVSVEESLARGDAQCRIVLHLRPSAEAKAADGREYRRA